MKRTHRTKTVLLPMLLTPSCVDVLDLDSFQDAIVELCKCDEQVPQFDGNCGEVLGERLAAVSEATRATWLSYYADQCAGNCDNAFACYQQKATCSSISCAEAQECCGYSDTDNATARCVIQGSATEGECQHCTNDCSSGVCCDPDASS